jgi:hypothetical protein
MYEGEKIKMTTLKKIINDEYIIEKTIDKLLNNLFK